MGWVWSVITSVEERRLGCRVGETPARVGGGPERHLALAKLHSLGTSWCLLQIVLIGRAGCECECGAEQ